MNSNLKLKIEYVKKAGEYSIVKTGNTFNIASQEGRLLFGEKGVICIVPITNTSFFVQITPKEWNVYKINIGFIRKKNILHPIALTSNEFEKFSIYNLKQLKEKGYISIPSKTYTKIISKNILLGL